MPLGKTRVWHNLSRLVPPVWFRIGSPPSSPLQLGNCHDSLFFVVWESLWGKDREFW